MAAGQISIYDKEPRRVTCGECRHFRRDTEGRSFSLETGDYFMGLCGLGLKPDTVLRQFANKKRICESYSEL